LGESGEALPFLKLKTMQDKKTFAVKLLKYYDQHYSLNLFEKPTIEEIVDEYLSKESRVSDEAIQIVLNDLSARKGSRILKLNDSRRKLIAKLFQDGYEINDFIEVNRHMVKKWNHDPKMRDYLTPETLYSEIHFTKYRELADNDEFQPAIERIKTATMDAVNLVRNKED